MQGSNVVRWLGWDVDSADLDIARQMATRILSHLKSIPHAVEFSGRKGYHIFVFLSENLIASDAKRVVDFVREKEGLKAAGDSHVEAFPKQDSLTRDRPKGSLIKVPLGEHPKSHDRSRFIDPDNGWENGPSLDPIEILKVRASVKDLLHMVQEGPAPLEELAQLLSVYWVDGKRHDLSLYLVGFLANEGWGSETTKDLVRAICQLTGDTDEFNRIQSVSTTYSRLKEGKTIRGRQGLAEILPTAALQKLTELASVIKAPDTVSLVDDIRFDKSKAKIESVRAASATIWSIMNDEGDKIIQTGDGVAYWYDHETHTVISEGTELWRVVLNKLFGLNPVDTWSKMIYSELRLRVLREAQIIEIMNRTYWSDSEKKLYLNLGGPEVFILDGTDNVVKTYNGECGYIFLTNTNGKYITPDFNAPPVDAWDYLIKDLSFATSEDAPATPEEQRELLKAWFLAMFFQEMMPTKPILAMLGVPGSGKTTAIRRILRIFEDPDADVLGVPTDKQDAFRSSISKHRLLVMDNLEKSGAGWMVDILNKLSTGNHIEIRELYKTNETHTIVPRCFVACTAVNMPFSDETLFSRLLILEMDKILDPLPEHAIQSRIRENGPAIWADLIRKLNIVVKTIKSVGTVRAPTSSRLADFTVFCSKLKECEVVDGPVLASGLLSMVDSQLKQLKESSQAITFIEEWIELKPDEAGQWNTMTQLFQIMQTMAQARRVDFKWKSSLGLERHLRALESRLRRDYQAEMEMGTDPHSGKEVTKVRFQSFMLP